MLLAWGPNSWPYSPRSFSQFLAFRASSRTDRHVALYNFKFLFLFIYLFIYFLYWLYGRKQVAQNFRCIVINMKTNSKIFISCWPTRGFGFIYSELFVLPLCLVRAVKWTPGHDLDSCARLWHVTCLDFKPSQQSSLSLCLHYRLVSEW